MAERTSRWARAAAALALLLASAAAMAHEPAEVRGDEWAVDPAVPGENLPARGRSLFDFVVVREKGGRKMYDVPFPFEALVARIEREFERDGSGAPAVKAVLIPQGRSLQRAAGEPRPYAFPRVVLVPDGEPPLAERDAGKRLKDRLYLGYHEKAEVIEVISYNEAAGRFEFQVVKDYRPGGKPQVFYANRAVCTACHQNAAPIFARQLWDETNANTAVAARLASERSRFYGVAPNRGVDFPYAVDNATDRANLYAAYQLLWREGCGAAGDAAAAIRCRAGLFGAALQYRLTGKQQYQRGTHGMKQAAAALQRLGERRFPAGLRIPSSDLPNRIPASGDGDAPGSGREISAAFDPLTPRAPLEAWHLHDSALLDRLVAGLADFIAETDVRRLDAHLQQARRTREVASFTGRCRLVRAVRERRERYDVDCNADEGGVSLRGKFYVDGAQVVEGTVDQIAFGADSQRPLRDIDVASGRVTRTARQASAELRLARGPMRARTAGGDAVTALRLTWTTPPGGELAGAATVTVERDHAPVEAAIEAIAADTAAGALDALSARPFRRAALLQPLFERLRMPPLAWCCDDAAGMPPPAMEEARVAVEARPAALEPFYRHCATCHQSPDRSPPNFLHGATSTVLANLAHCAPRLQVRLAMWQDPPDRRAKTPMPPQHALAAFNYTPDAWRNSAALGALRAYVERLLDAERSPRANPAAMPGQGYENLRECLP